MTKKIFGRTLVGLGLLIFISELYISYSIVSACLAGMGDGACTGFGIGIWYMLVYPFVLLLLVLYVIYLKKYSEGFTRGLIKFISLAAVLVLISNVPYSLVTKVQRAALSGGTVFGVDFTQYDPMYHRSTIQTMSDCERYRGNERCKIDYIKNENLGIELCDSLGDDTRSCRHDVMREEGFSNVTPEMCIDRLYVPKLAPHYLLRNCVTEVAKKLDDPAACKVLLGITGANTNATSSYTVSERGVTQRYYNDYNYYGKCVHEFLYYQSD